MADDERQDQPEEGQEPAGQEPEAQEPEAQDPETAAEEPVGDAPAEEPAADEPAADESATEEPAAEEPAADDAPAADAVTEGGDDTPGEDTGNGEEPAGGEEAGGGEAPAEGDGPPEGDEPVHEAEAAPSPRGGSAGGDDVIPGAHLEPDLVLEEERRAGEEGEYADTYAEAEGDEEPTPEAEEGEQPVAREPLDLAADARYSATGKRKTAVARVILKPGDGVYTVNGRHLDQFFPRVRLQRMAQQPLETAGYNGRMDVVARIRGGGVAAQAGALRHGIARALVEADPNLRVELKRRGFLTRDPREKERKKAGLKKARKRPQFSKR